MDHCFERAGYVNHTQYQYDLVSSFLISGMGVHINRDSMVNPTVVDDTDNQPIIEQGNVNADINPTDRDTIPDCDLEIVAVTYVDLDPNLVVKLENEGPDMVPEVPCVEVVNAVDESHQDGDHKLIEEKKVNLVILKTNKQKMHAFKRPKMRVRNVSQKININDPLLVNFDRVMLEQGIHSMKRRRDVINHASRLHTYIQQRDDG